MVVIIQFYICYTHICSVYCIYCIYSFAHFLFFTVLSQVNKIPFCIWLSTLNDKVWDKTRLMQDLLWETDLEHPCRVFLTWQGEASVKWICFPSHGQLLLFSSSLINAFTPLRIRTRWKFNLNVVFFFFFSWRWVVLGHPRNTVKYLRNIVYIIYIEIYFC